MTSNNTNVCYLIQCPVEYQSICTTDIKSLLYEVTVVTSIVNSLAAIFAVTANTLVIVAIWLTALLHSPSMIILCALAVTDLMTGLTAQPLLVMLNISRIRECYNMYCSASTGFTTSFHLLTAISFLTLTTISIDKYLAVSLHLRYSQHVTKVKIGFVLAFTWFTCITSVIFVPLKLYLENFIFFGTIVSIGFVLTSIAYCNAFRNIRKHEERIHAEKQQMAHFHKDKAATELKRQKKGSLTVAIVTVVFFLCNAPYFVVLILNAKENSDELKNVPLRVARNVSYTIVLLNATLNPVLYFYRMREIRNGVCGLMGIKKINTLNYCK